MFKKVATDVLSLNMSFVLVLVHVGTVQPQLAVVVSPVCKMPPLPVAVIIMEIPENFFLM